MYVSTKISESIFFKRLFSLTARSTASKLLKQFELVSSTALTRSHINFNPIISIHMSKFNIWAAVAADTACACAVCCYLCAPVCYAKIIQNKQQQNVRKIVSVRRNKLISRESLRAISWGLLQFVPMLHFFSLSLFGWLNYRKTICFKVLNVLARRDEAVDAPRTLQLHSTPNFGGKQSKARKQFDTLPTIKIETFYITRLISPVQSVTQKYHIDVTRSRYWKDWVAVKISLKTFPSDSEF